MRLGLEVEIEHDEQELLEAVGEVGLVVGLEVAASQSIEIALDPGEVAAILVDLERLDDQRECIWASRFETREDPQPVVDASRREQSIAERLVRERVPRLACQHLFKSGDRGIGAILFLEHHADVEIGGEQIGGEGQRALVRA